MKNIKVMTQNIKVMTQITDIFTYPMLIFGALLLILLYTQAIKKKYKIPYMLLTITFAVLGLSFNVISYDPDKSFFIFFMSITTILYYFFIESCSSYKANVKSLIPILLIFSIGQVFNFVRLIPTLSSSLYIQFNIWTLVLYGILGMVVYGGFGIRFNIKTYQMTKERTAFILTLANIFGLITYALFPIIAIINKGDISEINIFTGLTYILSTIFDALFAFGYIFNLDYIYRLPGNYFVLMVYYKSGVPIFQSQIQSRKDIKIEDMLVSGFLTAVNALFVETLSSMENIENISSKDASFNIRSGKFVSVVVIGEKTTAKLFDAITHFVKLVEDKYAGKLSEGERDLNEFSGIRELVPQCFPFFKLKIMHNKKRSEI